MYLQESLRLKLCISLLIISIQGGCSVSNKSQQQPVAPQKPRLSETLALPQQVHPPSDIQSVQLYPVKQPGYAPIIELNSAQQLKLTFDYLGTQSRQFSVTVVHHDQEWNHSSIGPTTYLDSFSETTIQSSTTSFNQTPSYRQVSFTFPNNELRPTVSGNYLIEVRSAENGDLLFSMPFFITENVGNIDTRVDQLYAQRNDGRPLDQLFSDYRYPDFVEYPQFDLAMSFVPNQFWGRTKIVNRLDTITPGVLHGYLQRERAFVGNYEFKRLNLQDFSTDGQNIIEYQPGTAPPKVTLRRDVQNLDRKANRRPGTVHYGIPDNSRDSQYARVVFQLETDDTIPQTANIFVVGHFNNWMITERNKMSYDASQQLWTGQALIKQGMYSYKYVVVENNAVNDLRLDQGFLSGQQEYYTLIYFNDPSNHFDRLLKVDQVLSR